MEDEGFYGSFLGLEGGVFAYVGNGRVFLSIYDGEGGVDAIGGEDAVFGEGEVGGRKAQDFMAPPEAVDYVAGDGVVPSQKAGSLCHITALDEAADGGAGDGVISFFLQPHHFHRDSPCLKALFEKGAASFGAPAEGEVSACCKAGEAGDGLQGFHEFFRRFRQKFQLCGR